MTLPRPLRTLGRTLGALSIAALPAFPITLGAALALSIPFALGAPPALAQDGDRDGEDDGIGDLLEQAMGQLQEKDYENALATYDTVIRRIESSGASEDEKAQVIQLAHYNSACALALQGKSHMALDRFERSLEFGFLDFDHISKDTDLDSIRGEKRFKELISRYKAKVKEASSAGSEKAKEEFLKQISKDALFAFDFDVKDVDETTLRLADMKGKVVLVDVWGTWCPPCRAEVPHLADLHKRLGPKGFSVVGLACERVPMSEAAGVVRKFLQENDVPYRSAVVDSKFPSKNIPDFEGFPTMLLVDRAGKVRMKVVGYTEANLLEAAVEQLLAEAAPEGKGAAPTPATPEKPEAPANDGGAKNGRREF